MGKRILIADDAAFMRMMLRKIVENGGFSLCGEAKNGREAVEKYISEKPDLILLDVTMPQMDGLEALEKIKIFHPGAKVIMCSSMGQGPIVMESIQKGALDFIVKPFKADKVIQTLNKAFGKQN